MSGPLGLSQASASGKVKVGLCVTSVQIWCFELDAVTGFLHLWDCLNLFREDC